MMKARLFILLIAVFGLAANSWATELILKDSTQIEETSIVSNGATANYGRVEQTSANRVVVIVGPSYSNTRKVLFRAPYLDDTLDACGVTGPVDSAYIQFWIQSIANVGDSTGVYWVIRASAVEAEKDWIEGNLNGATAIDAVTWDSCVHIGAGSGPGIAWATAGCAGTADTVGYRTGMTSDSVRVTMDSSAGDAIRFYLDPTDIDNMRTLGANNGWVLATSSKSGNIAVTFQIYGSESNMTGSTDSIPALHIFYGGTSAATKKIGAAKLGAGKL